MPLDAKTYALYRELSPICQDMPTTKTQPTAEQLTALRAYAAAHGRTWKAALRHEWETATASWPLMQIRNTFGPAWLARFRMTEDERLTIASAVLLAECAAEQAREPQRITIRRDRAANCYTATFHGDAEHTALLIRLCGSTTIPTPYTLQADPSRVVADIQQRNPDAVVTFAPESL